MCDCNLDYLCDQPDCIAERDEEAARFLAMFEAAPDPIAYTIEDLRADGVYGNQPYKYEDADYQ